MKEVWNKEIKQTVKLMPENPGVYLFYNTHGKIIYVGKAKNLKKRVSSYFSKNTYPSYKLSILVGQVVHIRHIIVNSESDALLLENTLIKKHQPKYNVLLKDDKTFPWICIKNESFPRVFSTRTINNDGSLYFGPYTSAFMVRTLLNLIRQLYPLRTCKHVLSEENIYKGKFKLCLEYHLGNCKGPCEGLQQTEEYQETIEQVKLILKGNLTDLVKHLEKQMKLCAGEFRYEEANAYKDKIDIISRYKSKSTIVNPSISDVDVFTIINDEKEAFVNYIKVYQGSVVQAHTIELKKKLDETDKELLLFAITDLRERTQSASKDILVPVDLQDELPDLRVHVPKRGDKKKLLDLSLRNARAYKLQKAKKASANQPLKSKERILKTLKQDLRLDRLPWHIECFDNSNLQGSIPVAACVVFKNGKPAKRDYRHYNIKTVSGADDYASMREVVYRRYKRLLDEKGEIPQLIIIDGGKGQLSAAVESLEKLDLKHSIAIIGIAKRLEEIYFPDDPIPLYIDKNSESLKLIQHLRNEAHRFGIRFHRQKREGALISSQLTEIEGIGEKSAEALLIKFRSAEAVFNASLDDLVDVVGTMKAKKIIEHHSKKDASISSGKQ